MWYFIIKQEDLSNEQYQLLQQKAQLTEVEVFSEPYANIYLFSAESYAVFVDTLDLEGIPYEAASERPERDDLRRA